MTALLNPRRKRRGRKGVMPAGLRRYWASKRRGGGGGKRRRRRNPANPANPRRRRRRASSVFGGRRRRARRHRNPGALVLNPRGGIMGTLKGAVPMVLSTGAGFIGTRYGASVVLGLVGQPDAGLVGYGANVAAAVGGYFLLRAVKQPKLAAGFIVGGLTAVALRAFSEFAPGTAQTVGLGAIEPAGMGGRDFRALPFGGVGAIEPAGVGCYSVR